MKDVVVKFFNAHGVLDPFTEERFSPETEEEWYEFEETETGSLKITYSKYPYVGAMKHRDTIAIYAAGRWAEVEIE